jgi:hypothetical protein
MLAVAATTTIPLPQSPATRFALSAALPGSVDPCSALFLPLWTCLVFVRLPKNTSFGALFLWSLYFISYMCGFILLMHKVPILAQKSQHVSMGCAATYGAALFIFSSIIPYENMQSWLSVFYYLFYSNFWVRYCHVLLNRAKLWCCFNYFFPQLLYHMRICSHDYQSSIIFFTLIFE